MLICIVIYMKAYKQDAFPKFQLWIRMQEILSLFSLLDALNGVGERTAKKFQKAKMKQNEIIKFQSPFSRTSLELS